MLFSEKMKVKKLPIREGYTKKSCYCEGTNLDQFTHKTLNEYYSNQEFDDYARGVRNHLVYEYGVDMEDANYITTSENTADFMHSVWFKMKPEDCADMIVDKLIINDGSVDKDAYDSVVLTPKAYKY